MLYLVVLEDLVILQSQVCLEIQEVLEILQHSCRVVLSLPSFLSVLDTLVDLLRQVLIHLTKDKSCYLFNFKDPI